MPVFQMVNPQSQQFTIFTEPLITLYGNLNQHVRIKKLSNNQVIDSEGYQGEIWGIFKPIKRGKVLFFKVILYIGEPSKRLELDENNEISEWLAKQEYYFPEKEFISYVESIDAMYVQTSRFMTLMMNMDVVSVEGKEIL